jgi:hypothetical protein
MRLTKVSAKSLVSSIPSTCKQLLKLVYEYASGPCIPNVSIQIISRSISYDIMEEHHTPLLARCSFRELIEYVEIALVLHLTNNASLLEQVIGDLGADWF